MAAKSSKRTGKKTAKASKPKGARAAENAARKPSPKKPSGSSGSTMAARKVRPGFISHTELASSDPAATKAWAEQALGWKFIRSMPTPNGPYHMWQFAENQGGGIRSNNPSEAPGSIPYVEVADIRGVFDKAVKAGATPMMPPEEIEGGMGWIAVVQAPGGPAVGFWGPPSK